MTTYEKDLTGICVSSKRDMCIQNIINMTSLITPFDEYRSSLQGLYIRDKIKDDQVFQHIFINAFGFDFQYNRYKVAINNFTRTNFLRDMTSNLDGIITQPKIYIIRISIPSHANIHYVDNIKKEVYVYEPHMPTETEIMNKYWYVQKYRDYYLSKSFTVKELPNNILTQRGLPLCFMYVIHFFLYLFLSQMDNQIGKYNQRCDDIYIMKFTRDMLKICHEYNLVDSSDYYLLTNNTYKVRDIINKIPAIEFVSIFEKVSSQEMIELIAPYVKQINICSLVSAFFLHKKFGEKYVLKLMDYLISFINITMTITITTEFYVFFEIARSFETVKKYAKKSEQFGMFFDEKMRENIRRNSQLPIELTCKLLSLLIKNYEEIQNDLQGVQFLLNNDIGFNSNKILSILMKAIQTKNADLVRLILEKRPDITQKYVGYTALMYAVKSDVVEIVRLMLDYDRLYSYNTINSRNASGKTALVIAILQENVILDIVRLLLDNNADVNIDDQNNMTPLMHAIMQNLIVVVRLILEKNPNINAVNANKRTALMEAIIKQYIDIIRLLLDYDRLHSSNTVNFKVDGASALTIAIDIENESIINLLLDNGANFSGTTPLIYAVYKRKIGSIRTILKRNPNINEKGTDGQTALMFAIEINSADIVRLILEKNPDISIRSDDGSTALTMRTTPDITKLLHEYQQRLQTKQLLTVELQQYPREMLKLQKQPILHR